MIGNGFAGAENQCIGLVRALGLSNRQSLYHVTRPRGGINKWLHWLPVSLHKKLDYVIRRLCGNSKFLISNKVAPFSTENAGLSSVLEADGKQIKGMA